MSNALLSRRSVVAAGVGLLLAGRARPAGPAGGGEMIDLHQHTNYLGRSDDELVTHQRALGVTKTVLLPAGSRYGLAAGAGGNQTVLALARRYPDEFAFFANEVPTLPGARAEIEKYLKLGAIGIGEQKFNVECDSQHIRMVAEVAREFRVPVLLHFQHGEYNTRIERFHRILEQFPAVNFIGHAQTWWGNIDRNHDQTVMYPKTRVTPGGITDRYLSDYPNMYGDLSAGSGLNALLRDEEHAREFLARHAGKLLYGSDCNDRQAHSEKCIGSKGIAAIRRLAPGAEVAAQILSGNARRLLRL